jgi:hypothetical protein
MNRPALKHWWQHCVSTVIRNFKHYARENLLTFSDKRGHKLQRCCQHICSEIVTLNRISYGEKETTYLYPNPSI